MTTNANANTTARYIVMTASARMPGSCWGRYGRVAVVELEPGFSGRPKMISERARGVRRVVQTWERRHMALAEQLNRTGELAYTMSLVADAMAQVYG